MTQSKSDRYKDINDKLNLRANTWPHQFTKDGAPQQVGEDQWHNPMVCVHCGKRFISGKDPRPMESCPARNDRSEMGRLLR